MDERGVAIPARGVSLAGDLAIPDDAAGLVVFAHGSGSGRKSPRNRQVAAAIRRSGFATLLFDLLTVEEEARERYTGELRFDIRLLAERLVAATRWAQEPGDTRGLPLGYFGASTGAAAALVAAAELGDAVAAVVSRGGRPDLADRALAHVRAPTLLVVGELDHAVIGLNREAFARLRCEREITVVPGAGHLFEERGALEQVATLAIGWFRAHLAAADARHPRAGGGPIPLDPGRAPLPRAPG